MVDRIPIDATAQGLQVSHDDFVSVTIPSDFKPTSHPEGQPPPQPPPGYYPPPPPGYYPPPPGYNQPPPGYYYQQPPPGYYYAPPPQDVGRHGQVLIDHRPRPPPPPPPPPTTRGYQPSHGRQDSDSYIFTVFDDPAIRSAFIRKVYSILSIQLGFTTGVIALFVLVEPIRDFVRLYWPLLIIALVFQIAIYLVLVCCTDLRRLVPWNYILLAVFTVAMAYLTGTISAFYGTRIVLYTFAITCVVCILVTVIAVFSCIDITGCGAVLCILSICLAVFGVFALIIGFILHSNIMILIYAWLAAMLMCAYLMYDTQLIMGGRSVELSPEEYILAVICLYTDIVNMFLNMLMIVACCCGGGE